MLSELTIRDFAIIDHLNLRFGAGFNVLTGGGATGPSDHRDLTIAFTQVWRREDGNWLREAFQATPVVDRIAS